MSLPVLLLVSWLCLASTGATRVRRQLDNDLSPGSGHGYSGTVVDGKSSYILKFNRGVPVYGGNEPYYFSYTHNFPIATSDFQHQVNSHNLPNKYKFTGSLDVTDLL